MGDLISNLIGAQLGSKQQKAQEEAQQIGQQLQMYSYVLQAPGAPPQLKQAAHQHLLNLAEEHGGKEASDNLPQLGQYLTRLAAPSLIHQALQKRALVQALQQRAAAQGQGEAQGQGGSLGSQFRRYAVEPEQEQAAPAAPPASPPPSSPSIFDASGRGGLIAGTPPSAAPPPAARAATPAPAPTPAAAPTPATHPSFRQRLGNILTGFAYGMHGQETPERQAMIQASAQAAARAAEEQQHLQRIDQFLQRGWITPEQANEARRRWIMGEPLGTNAATAQKQTTVELDTGEVVPAWEDTRRQTFETLDGRPIDPKSIRNVGVPVEPKLTGRLLERQRIEEIIANKGGKYPPNVVEGAKKELAYMDAQADQAVSRSQIQQRQLASGQKIVPGTPEFKVAQDLAYGKLTFQGFRALYAYSRDEQTRLAIYNKATELNPNFSEAQFTAGYRFFARPQTRQQLAAIDNVEAGVGDLLRLSDAAERAGAPVLNQFINPGGYMVGNRNYSNFNLARTAFADELSGALGMGGATDMTRQMGFDMTDPNLSPAQFRDGVQRVVWGFLNRKRDSLIDEMSVYGDEERKRAEELGRKQGLTPEGMPRPSKPGKSRPTQETVNLYMETYGSREAAKEQMRKDGWNVNF